MPFPWNMWPWNRDSDLNVAYWIKQLEEISRQAVEDLTTLEEWKTGLEQGLETWKSGVLTAISTWENEFTAAMTLWKTETEGDLDEWKAGTQNDIATWEADTLAALNVWKAAFLAQYETIEQRVDAIVSSTEEMVENLAEPFSSTKTYEPGDYVIQNGILYRFTTTHPAGAWNAAHAVQTTAMNDISVLWNNLFEYNVVNVLDTCPKTDQTFQGITYKWHADGSCTVTGSASATSFNTLFAEQNRLPHGVKAGDTVEIQYQSDNIFLYIYNYTGGSTSILYGAKTGGILKIPETCTGLLIRLWIANGTQNVDENVKPVMLNYNRLIREDGYIKAVDVASENESGKIDMRNAIQYALNTYKRCHLSTGAFYISQRVSLPQGGTLEGEGPGTELRLLQGNQRNAINAHKDSLIKDLSVIGAYNDLTESDFTATEGSRYGIFYRKGGDDYSIPTGYVGISNVQIRNFTAAGIYQYDAGQNVSQGLFVENVEIKNCWVGIQIYTSSEFCHYVNTKITYCFYACINNGGNNVFDSCVFHAYYCGMRINGSLPNSGHGSCSNSSFCHTGDNTGMAVHVSDLLAGYIFDACNFWYNSILIQRSEGCIFGACIFGRGTGNDDATITIIEGACNIFTGCSFIDDTTYPPTFTITQNTKTKFVGCFGSKSGNAITA